MNIDILVGIERHFSPNYYVYVMAEIWKKQGHRINVRRLADGPGDADLSILHVDLSTIPAEQVAPHVNRGPVINGKVLDISKRAISSILCTPDGDYDGPVLIKTNLNHGGDPERALLARSRLREYADRIWRKLPWWLSRDIRENHYPILPNVRAVPDWVWRSDQYVVDRFVPERDGDYYVTRSWDFFGDKEYVTIRLSPSYYVRGDTMFRLKMSKYVPEEIRRRRRELGFDFGKFDFVIHNGEPYLLDVNRTPTLLVGYVELSEVLADGLRRFL